VVSTGDLLEQIDRPRPTALDLGDWCVRITSPDRVLWPASYGEPPITRRDLLRYFASTAEHLKHRPLTLLRYPTGIYGKHFFQKHVDFEPPPFVDRAWLTGAGWRPVARQPVAQSRPGARVRRLGRRRMGRMPYLQFDLPRSGLHRSFSGSKPQRATPK